MGAALQANRRWRVAMAGLVVLGGIAWLAVGARPAHAKVRTAHLAQATTDNYKASYNADPAAPENRSWLAMRHVRVGKRKWRMHPRHVRSGTATFPQVMRLKSGRRGATLRVEHVRGPMRFAYFRVGPQRGWFGVFLQTRGVSRLRKRPVVLRLVVRRKGRTIAQRTIRYRYAPKITRRALEKGGPHGRWWVGKRRTPTNLERGRPV